LPENLDSQQALVKFLIWLLVFTVIYTGVDKVFNKDGKRKGTSLTISAVVSIMGVIMIPNAFIKEIFTLYSDIVTWALVIAPGLVGVFIAQTKFKGEDFANKGARVIVIALLLYAYTTLGANAVAQSTGIGTTLNMGAILSYGTTILSILLAIYLFGVIKSIGKFGSGTSSGSGSGGFGGAEGAIKGMSSNAKDTVKNRAKIEDDWSTEEKIESDMEHISAELEGFTASGWEDIGKLEKDVNALSAVVSKYGGQMNTNSKLKEYLLTVLKDLEKNKTVLDDIVVKISADLIRFKGEVDYMTQVMNKMFDSNNFKTFMLDASTDDRTKGEIVSIQTNSNRLIQKAQSALQALQDSENNLKSDNTNFVKLINGAFVKLQEVHVEDAKKDLSSAAVLVSDLKSTFDKMKQLENLEGKYIGELRKGSRRVQSLMAALLDSAKND